MRCAASPPYAGSALTGGVRPGPRLRRRRFARSRWFAAVALMAVAVSCTPDPELSSRATPDSSPAPTNSAPAEPTEPPAEGGTGESACLHGGGAGDATSKISFLGAAGFVPGKANGAPGRAQDDAASSAPRADRPVVRLCFDVPADRRVVTGHETVVFTPDKRICEVIFRAWPNKPETAYMGNRLDVLGATVDGEPVEPVVEAAGAPDGSAGTLIRLPLQRCVRSGQPLTIDLDFSVRLGRDTPERVGYSSGDLTAWLATAFPLLAWERGVGWATEPAVELFGETVTSEEFELAELRVIAPKADTVLGTGQALGTRPGPRPSTTEHRFSAPAVRDVAVSVGRFEVEERTVAGTRLRVGALPDVRFPVERWTALTAEAVRDLTALLGPFPYDDLWVTIVPDIGSGIEFPGAIQFGDTDPRQYPELIPHEVAHMWFYGLVGNNQARDPWLDESFAEYSEVMISGDPEDRLGYRAPGPVRYEVGRGMRWYDALNNPDLYGQGVYRQGAAMLIEIRQAIGAQEFDRLIRNYIEVNAHQIVTDDDVRRAFAGEPEALAIFDKYGAFID